MRAQRGSYAAERARDLVAAAASRASSSSATERRALHFEVRPEVAALITFKQLNLMHPLPMKGPLHAIFCRNVVIYFDKDTQRELFARVAQLQRPGDLLFLGHSESLFKVSEDYALDRQDHLPDALR